MWSWLMNRLEINFTFSVKLIPRARTSQLSQQAESKALALFKPSYLQLTFCFPRTKKTLCTHEFVVVVVHLLIYLFTPSRALLSIQTGLRSWSSRLSF